MLWNRKETNFEVIQIAFQLLSDIYKEGSTTYRHTWMSVDCNLPQRAYVCKKPVCTEI